MRMVESLEDLASSPTLESFLQTRVVEQEAVAGTGYKTKTKSSMMVMIGGQKLDSLPSQGPGLCSHLWF
ncbi:hypothetical protein U1Q18_015271 [Sarracenia purpurea var. burkii]